MPENKYIEYFDINETYFPCIDESAINAGAPWNTTYPHETFIELLNSVEKMLGGATKRSVWIHGAYGTGKSQCAYALKKILEVSEQELNDYWNKFEPLKKQQTLLEKIKGHKERGIITVFRYASGGISTPEQLFFAVQESISNAIKQNINVQYKGENSLKESVITWLEDPIHSSFVDKLLQKPEWMALFSQSTATEIINSLKKSTDVTGLMANIFTMASKEGITALSLSAETLRLWIADILQNNNMKMVFIWDEFSGFFRQNRNSLDELQKLVAFCQEIPFYFVIVTHPITSISNNDEAWKIVQQRFNKVEIALPPNIAFDLIGHAFTIKAAAKDSWQTMVNALNAKVPSARKAIMNAVDIKKESVMSDIIPIHPVAALVLKNIASAFQSNQRSMFDFIKTPKDMDVKAFQWFIKTTGPLDERPLLTVDMLWNFFYEKGKDYLSADIKLVLDTFPQQENLKNVEKTVLKTILIMQAIDQRLGGALSVLKPTDQNLSYAFEGDAGEYETGCKNIAKALVSKGILIQTPIGDGKKVYSAAILAGDNTKIDNFKKDIKKVSTTAKLVTDGPALGTALSLTPALKLRYALNYESGAIPVVTKSDFIKTLDTLKNKDSSWKFYAVLALAKTEEEAQDFRKDIKDAVKKEEYKNITIIDALSTPLGLEAYGRYVDFMALSLYYNHNNSQQSKENAKKASQVIEVDWKNKIHDGQFIVFNYEKQDGEKANGAGQVQTILKTIVLKKHPYALDFSKDLNESHLKSSVNKQIVRYSFGDSEVKGLIKGCEKYVLGKVWARDKYWCADDLKNEPIVNIKKKIDEMITKAFKSTGKISIADIYDELEDSYGFAPCNMYAFVMGFLLREYGSDPYRSMNEEGHRDPMTPDKLSEMIAFYIGKNKNSYIVNLTEDEKAFYDLTEKAWGIEPNTCSSPNHAATQVLNKMKELDFPVWCLEDVDTTGAYDFVKMYINLVQNDGDKAHDIANNIGKIANQRKQSADLLKALLTKDNCKNGMQSFLNRFENGKLIALAKDINALDNVLADVKSCFAVQYAALWNTTTGEDEIRKLIVVYEVIKLTNILLNTSCQTKDAAFTSWRETLKFLGSSSEAIADKKPELVKLLENLKRIADYSDMLSENIKSLNEEMTNHFDVIKGILSDSVTLFIDVYKPYLDGFTREEIETIKNSLTVNMFILPRQKSNETVKTAAEEFKKNQVKEKLLTAWKAKTQKSKNPRNWSTLHRTPILCCVSSDVYSDAKKAFEIINKADSSETDIKFALEFINNATFFDDISDSNFRDKCFIEKIVGDYSILLPNVEAIRDELEKLALEPYDWFSHPMVVNKIKEMAKLEYDAGGSEKTCKIIEGIGKDKLVQWLKDMAETDLDLGIKILKSRGE